jgi:hypothetical protein
MKDNLAFLLKLRHEIEHRSTSRIDDAVSAKLQACCVNFNDAIKRLFGSQYGLERRLPIALQFVTFSPDQRAILKKAGNLPRHVETMMYTFERELTDEQRADPRFAFRVLMVHRTATRPSGADLAVELVAPGSAEASEINTTGGYRKFTIARHTELWQKLKSKDPAKSFGVTVGKQWYWYETWLTRVREESQKQPALYGFVSPRPPGSSTFTISNSNPRTFTLIHEAARCPGGSMPRFAFVSA